MIYELPVAANDNHHSNGRRYGETLADFAERARAYARAGGQSVRAASLETPFERECREGRIPVDLELTAKAVEVEFERASRRGGIPVSAARNSFAVQYSSDPVRPIGQEVTTDARRMVVKFERAAGDRWRAILMAIIERATMLQIGLSYGAPVRRAAPPGLQLGRDGLIRIDRAVYDVPAAANDNAARPEAAM